MRRPFDLWRDQRGNTAMIFGLALIPLLALGGGVVDLAQRARIHGEMQSASDTAALAAARVVQDGLLKRNDWDPIRAQAYSMANQLITASLTNLGETPPQIDIEVTQKTVSITAHYDMKTAFLGVIGINTLPASTFAEVNVPDPILVEISFVLDYSLSMLQNSKYQRMTAAARDFISKVAANRGDRTKIGIVPFSEFVYANVADSDVRPPETGGTNQWDGSPDRDGSSSWSSQTHNTDPTTPTTAKCLLNRDYPYSVTNSTPNGAEASRWRQADPDSARCKEYVNGGLEARDLTDDFTGLSNALAGMQPVGWTNIALATEMGWHMLSPNEPFETARDYSDPNLRKILVLLTDGVQTVEAMGPTGEISIDGANRTTAQLCGNIKASNVALYTIAYDVDNPDVYDLLSNCASGPGSYFEVHDSSDIGDVFNAIYNQIVESAWLSR